jgi:hypothetical protein
MTIRVSSASNVAIRRTPSSIGACAVTNAGVKIEGEIEIGLPTGALLASRVVQSLGVTA